MQCDEARPRLDAYIDGELAEDERAPLLAHLADCPECGPEAAALTRLRDGIRLAAPIYRAPEALRSYIRTAPRAEAAASASAARAAPGWLAYAASILVAVAVGSGGTLLVTGEGQGETHAPERIDNHLRPRADRQPSALVARQPSDRCRFLRPAHGQAVVRRKERPGAACRRPRQRGFSAGWRPARCHS